MVTCWQVDNVRRLADTLEKVATEWPEHFDMGSWVDGVDFDNYTSGDHHRHLAGEHPAKCGTTGCALGWAPYALGAPKPLLMSWKNYAREYLGIYAMDFAELFTEWSDQTGADAARAKADELRAWADEHAGDCADEEEVTING